MEHHFFAYISRMRFIQRWGLMRNTLPENDLEHAAQAAGSRTGTSVSLHPWEEAAAACAAADVVISTLPPRAADPLAESLAAAAGDRTGAVLLDAAYDPWPSRIARAWEEAGGRIVPGQEMLLYQAVEQVRLFAGDKFRDEAAVINVMCDAVGLPRR